MRLIYTFILPFFVLFSLYGCDSSASKSEESRVSIEEIRKDEVIEEQKSLLADFDRRFSDYQKKVNAELRSKDMIVVRYDSLHEVYKEMVASIDSESAENYRLKTQINKLKISLSETEQQLLKAEKRVIQVQDSLGNLTEQLLSKLAKYEYLTDSLNKRIERYEELIATQAMAMIKCSYQWKGMEVLLSTNSSHKASKVNELKISLSVNPIKYESIFKQELSPHAALTLVLFKDGEERDLERVRLQNYQKEINWSKLPSGNYSFALRHGNQVLLESYPFQLD
ncbi:MAG: hypothetical protein JJT94_10395 [Bernardetiaceae bacterium]|nr:hypothetical protein [Bernardetiaceae bacterium]